MKLKTGNLYKEDWLKLSKTIADLSTSLFFIDDNPMLSIEDIRTKVKKVIFEQNNLGLIIIDYLQLMHYTKFKIENRAQELSKITRSLKNLAKEFNIPLIALSQLNRNVETRLNKRPILSDLRESGSIEQDADVVLLLYKNNESELSKKTQKQLTELIIAKQRNGPTGTIQLYFNPKYTKFSNINEFAQN